MNYKVKQEQQLLDFLFQTTSKKRNGLKNLLKYKSVKVNGQVITQHNYLLQDGDEVSIDTTKKETLIDIIYEDDDFIVINKPCGLLTERTQRETQKTAFQYVNTYLKKKRQQAYLVHRLDQYTSGVLMFVKRKDLYELMIKNWNKLVKKRNYVALVQGSIKKDGVIETYLYESKSQLVKVSKTQGKKAITIYKVLKSNKQATLLDIYLQTGRKNQIRVHMDYMGHPILGDDKYGHAPNSIGRLALHCKAFEFIHPKTKKLISVKASVPKVILDYIKE